MPPFSYSGAYGFVWYPSLRTAVEGAELSYSLEAVRHHEKQINRRDMWLVLCLLAALPVVIWSMVMSTEPVLHTAELLESSALIPVTATFVFFASLFAILGVSVPLRIASILIDRSYAESLCVSHSIYLLTELRADDSISNPLRRHELIRRLDWLAQSLLLLGLHYSTTSESNRSWSYDHFRNIEMFVRTRQRWVIAPQSTTLADLRVDFTSLATELITMQFGAYVWEDDFNIGKGNVQSKPGTRALKIASVLLPAGLLLIGMFHPATFVDIGLEPKTMVLFGTAWLLLTIDATLQLGAVSGVTNLAKSIKEIWS
jgi:hypothetical protein